MSLYIFVGYRLMPALQQFMYLYSNCFITETLNKIYDDLIIIDKVKSDQNLNAQSK